MTTTTIATPVILVPSRTRPGLMHEVRWDERTRDWRCSCEWETYRRQPEQHRCWHVATVDRTIRDWVWVVYGESWPCTDMAYYARQWLRSGGAVSVPAAA